MTWWKQIRERLRGPNRGSRLVDTEVAVRTDIGCTREENEDSVLFVRPKQTILQASRGVLAIVADGMGGANTGEIASQLACQTISDQYFAAAGSPGQALAVAFAAGNRRIFGLASEQLAFHGMGTTAAALALVRNQAWFANVGDSRIYLLRDSCLHQLSHDDSLVAQMVRDRLITAAQARCHQDRNILVRALGTKPELKLGREPAFLECWSGDRFLLCSDGLYDLMSEQELLSIAGIADVNCAANTLIEIAKERGGPDNISVALVALCRQPTSAGALETREVLIG